MVIHWSHMLLCSCTRCCILCTSFKDCWIIYLYRPSQ